jgi:hypothetical protein
MKHVKRGARPQPAELGCQEDFRVLGSQPAKRGFRLVEAARPGKLLLRGVLLACTGKHVRFDWWAAGGRLVGWSFL